MISPIPLVLRRTGSFRVAFDADNTNQCGRYQGQRDLDYAVEITSHSACLDDRGFIIENSEIQSYFDRTYSEAKVFVSCELIALRAVVGLHRLMGKNRCSNVKVQIIPQPLASITAEKSFPCTIGKQK